MGVSRRTDTLQWMALWIDTQSVSTVDPEYELCFSSGGRQTAEGISEISLVWRKWQKLIDSVWLTIVCVLRLPTVWRPEVWRLMKSEGDETFTHIISNTRVWKNNNILQNDCWKLISPTTHTRSALVFHAVSKDNSLFDKDPLSPCAAHNYLGSNGSYILPIHI